ncbi:hypothetical protein [Cupriavidus sp. D384]|uniref:hypothetical protein n=1 Tax=Cupriavidus sp. D384 TaxID=1538095 RepID=UPI00082B8E39|nr:hypothetical protein [Cupriavidus sp. D384]
MTIHKTIVSATFECQYGAFLEASLHIEFEHLPADPSVGINEDDIDITEVRMQLVDGGWMPFNGDLKNDELRFQCWEALKAERERAESDYADSWIQERKDVRVYLGAV